MEWACEKQKKSIKETCQTFKIVILGDLGYVRLLQQQHSSKIQLKPFFSVRPYLLVPAYGHFPTVGIEEMRRVGQPSSILSS